MLTYTFAKGSGESLYEQLYDRIKADILTGAACRGGEAPVQADACRPSGAVGYHGEERL